MSSESIEWEKEAKKRGLSNNKTTPLALRAKISEQSLEIFRETGVMNEVEVRARYDIEVDEYALRIQIESRVLGDIARNHIVPTAIKYQNTLIENVKGLKEIFGSDFEIHAKEQLKLIKSISILMEGVNSKIDLMIEERKKANKLTNAEKKALRYCDNVKPYLDLIRYDCDKLEMLIDDELWPLVKYREMLFIR
jgi:glutamine synthetase